MSLEQNPISSYHAKFVENLARSRVTQTIFEQMFREGFGYYVYPLGYEYSAPEMVDHRKDNGPISEDFDKIRNQPDFRIYTANAPRNVSLVEVKYQRQKINKYLLADVEELFQMWPTSHIFLATQENFFMSTCKYILDSQGDIMPFSECGFIENLDDLGKRKIQAYYEILKKVLGVTNKLTEEPEKYTPRKVDNGSTTLWFFR